MVLLGSVPWHLSSAPAELDPPCPHIPAPPPIPPADYLSDVIAGQVLEAGEVRLLTIAPHVGKYAADILEAADIRVGAWVGGWVVVVVVHRQQGE